MLPDTALQVVRDELILDGNPRLNLATFVTTWMEPQAEELMAECLGKNMIDKDEYPQTAELESRCVNILASLWHARERLGGDRVLDHRLQRGLHARRDGAAVALAPPARRHRAPNLVMGANVQVCWEKFCRYWRVEPRLVPLEPGRLHLTGPEAAARVRREHHRRGRDPGLDARRQLRAGRRDQRRTGPARRRRRPGCPHPRRRRVRRVHRPVPAPRPRSGTSGSPRVASINASGHKYGLVYPGVGWVVWRDSQALPEDLVFKVNYLGGEMPTFALNFSRSGAHVAAQYYNFLRLGFDGYRRVQQACQDVALHLSSRIAGMGPFELLTDGATCPSSPSSCADDQAGYSVFDLSERLRDPRLAGARLHPPAEPGRHRGDADRGPQRIQP